MKNYVVAAALAVLLCGAICRAATFDVTVDTTPISGQPGFVVFDLVGGSSVQGNTATIQSFATNSTLGTATTSGSVLGKLVPGPLSLSDAQFLSEWNQALTFGTHMSFKLSVTTNNTPGEIPDAFSFYLLDNNKVPFATTDPT